MDHFDKFDDFSKSLIIDSKEEGQRPLYPLLGTQAYALRELRKGMEEGIHTFLFLKGRQAAISTLCNAVTTYWTHRHPGMQATLVTDDESNRETFRQTISLFIESLPARYRVAPRAHNRTHLILKNRSRLIYQVAGKKLTASSASLGQGKGIAYLHGTEVASWPDPDGVSSLMASLAEQNPNRLYLFESTAKGHNIWEEIWLQAKRAVTQRAIFVGWYRNEKYAFPVGHKVFATYWGEQPKMTAAERERAHIVERTYGIKITPEQIAWYRYQLFEKFHEDDNMLAQEHPWHEEEAFVMSGAQWFHSKMLSDAYAIARRKSFNSYRFHLSNSFEETQLFDAIKRHAELKVWEEPKPGGIYVLAADPAYGSSDNADRFVIQVLRCYADQVEQVAEYATVDCTTAAFAWIIMALCGAYGTTYFILEINGPGGAVFDQMKTVRQRIASVKMWDNNQQMRAELRAVLKNIRNYVWAKPDSLSNGSNTIHWKTNFENKSLIMNVLRDAMTIGILTVNSEECLREMRAIVREPNGDIKGDGSSKDDRVIALALGVQMWQQRVRPLLMRQGATRAYVEEQQNKQAPVQSVTQLMVVNHLRQAGIKLRGRSNARSDQTES